MDKKLIIIGIVVVVLVLGGLAIWKYSINNNASPTPESNANVEPSPAPADQGDNNIQVQVDGISAKGSDGNGVQGGLIICVDKCGDGICQKADTTCPAGSSNCVCAETKNDCSQDCK